MANEQGSVRRDGLTIEYDHEHCYTEYDSCAIQVWRGEVLARHMPLMRARWETLVKRRGSMAMLVIVLDSAPPPSNARRQDIKMIYVDLAENLEAIASVFEAQGLKGSTASLVMSTMLLLAKSTFPTKNTTSIAVATDWLENNTKSVSASGLKNAVDGVLKEYGQICQRKYGEGLVLTRRELRARKASA